MSKKAGAIILLVLIVFGAYLIIPKGNNDIPAQFDPGDRYQFDRLDYMGVIYVNQSDIYAFNEGYSESDNCPWGFIHNGIDFFFKNGSTVIAAAPGQVESITWSDWGEDAANQFHVTIIIRFNATTIVHYNFEPWTKNESDKDLQLSLIEVKVGDWVAKGDKIATFLNILSGAHIHFGVIQDNEWQCPKQYLSEDAYNELMSLVHSYHPDWDLCYP